MSRSTPFFKFCLLAGLGGCAAFLGSPKKSSQSKPGPAWTQKKVFFETLKAQAGWNLYASGSAQLPKAAPGACPRPNLLLERAAGRARAQLAKALYGAQDAATIAKLSGTSPALAWFDGDRKIVVLIKTQTSTRPAAGFVEHRPKGGIAAAALEDEVRAKLKQNLEKAGICASSHDRPRTPCCGPQNQFCSDAKRFSQKKGATCACGPEAPCLYDFQCEARWQRKACVCQGPKCPCKGYGNCRIGQSCGDGRCY